MPKSAKSLVALVIASLGLCASGLARADIVFTLLYTEQDYLQTSTNISFTGDSFYLSLNTTGASDFNAATVSIPTPTATQVQLAYNPVLDSSGSYRAGSVSTYFPSSSGNVAAGVAAMNAVYPMGTYTFTATNSITNTSQTATLVYDQNYWPTAPRTSGQTAVPTLTATSYARLQGLNPNQAQVFNFNTFTGNAVALPGEVDPATYLTIYTTAGQTVYASPALSVGTSSLLLPANTLQANTTYYYDLGFLNGLHCGAGSLLCGTDHPLAYGLSFATDTLGEFTTATTSTPPPTTVTLQGGTLANPVPLQSQGQIGQVDGLIGGEGAMDFYLFNWTGGTFMANAALTGADPNATYEFELLDLFGNLLQDITLNAADNFTADLSEFLSAGKYEIGLLADSPFDPPFTITFVTPVNGVPEPATFALVALGLAGIGFTKRRKTRRFI